MATSSPNMNLPVSVIGTDTGLAWETNLNASLSIVDGHNHTPGSGVQIPPSGLDINSSLTFQNNQATNVQAVAFTPQPGVITLWSIYAVGNDLYYTDGTGTVIQITKLGSVNVTSSGISSGTASAAFSAGVLVVNSAPLTPGDIQYGSALLGNNVSNSNFLKLSPPTMGTGGSVTETIVLPALPPTVTSFVTLSPTGTMLANTTIDGTTIVNNSNVLSVAPYISGAYTEHQFEANGPYSSSSVFPQTAVDGPMIFNANATIIAIWIFNLDAGISGTTEFDMKIASPGGSFSSILSTTGKITSAAASNIWTDSNAVVGSQTGVTKPVLTSALVTAGQALRFDILQTMVGASNCGVLIQYQSR